MYIIVVEIKLSNKLKVKIDKYIYIQNDII